MILTGPRIKEEVEKSSIIISPFNENLINPNSYDFRLGPILRVYKKKLLDSKIKNESTVIKIPKDGIVLKPDRLYLGHTIEVIGSTKYIPILRGKSTTGRLGLFIHITADLIDIGSIGQFTLMLHAVQPIRIYSGVRIGQVTFWKPKGNIKLYTGKYQHSVGPRASEAYKDDENINRH